eukprot:1077662-Rhodomonas_salina.2
MDYLDHARRLPGSAILDISTGHCIPHARASYIPGSRSAVPVVQGHRRVRVLAHTYARSVPDFA